jgi:hypothetical protein
VKVGKGMRRGISTEQEALKGVLKILSTWLDFVEVKTFSVGLILPTA